MDNTRSKQTIAGLISDTLLCIILFIMLGSCVIDSKRSENRSTSTISLQKNTVVHIVDGDTFDMTDSTGKLFRIRPIGINADELRDNAHGKKGPYAKAARDFLSLLIYLKKVRIETDIQKKDKYGRLLAYVYVSDTIFVNAELVRQGMAVVETVPPNVKYADYFFALQQEARTAKAGMWAEQ
ncbi:MAG: thermonuclease family protein [Bacteroidetes bacterium]|nr:thermonuclease family protein [Bacteroidota bacterium]